jgi:EmrB/QacA subfamily drug resistance transporter
MSQPTGEPAAPPAGDPGAPPAHLSHREILVVLGGLMTGMLLAALDQSIVGTALPRIVSELGGLDKLSWVVTAYLLTSTAATPLWGKISDLYGRRLIFQAAIVTFLIGSALSGAAQNMTQLIGFRAVQGLGAGGLMSIALAVIGDVIPARERGRYQGYFAAVFGISSVAGPLLGGWLTDGPGWRWIFYINLPIGAGALVATSIVLHLPRMRREHSIDYLGAALIVAAVSSIMLYLDWRGQDYGWTEGLALVLLFGGVLLAVLFVLVERRASEPIIPLRLFRNSIYTVSNIYGFIAGMAMFGAIIFLPLYLQAVKGYSPTKSGLALLPVVVGIFSTSITSGRLISKTGKYRIYPIIGAAVLVVAMWMLSRLHLDTPYWGIGLAGFVFGAGLGFTMQTILVAVQNSVEFRDMGTASSSVAFFRSMGGAIGTAVFGAVLSNRLAQHLQDAFAGGPVAAQMPGGSVTRNIKAIQALPEPVRGKVLLAFTQALHDVFLVGVPFVMLAFVVALFLREIPLQTRATAPAGPGPSGESTPAPVVH